VRYVRSCIIWFGTLGCGLALLSWSPTASLAVGSVPTFDHIFVIVLENHWYPQIIGNTAEAPYLNQLAGQYGLATHYFALTHPSLPNYLALIGGDTFGITTDCMDCFLSAPNLAADRVAPSGRTWRAYLESLPSPCFLGDAYPYVQRHQPFIYFDDIRTTGQCSNVVPLSDFAADLASAGTTPSFAWITPNLCHDMHDCSIATGDAWLQDTVSSILSSPAYATQQSLVVITWDEDDYAHDNQVATLVIAKSVPPGFRSGVRYDHYSLLKTIEQAWGLAPLTANDGNASPMSDFFAPSSTPTPTATPTNTPVPPTATPTDTPVPPTPTNTPVPPTPTPTNTPMPVCPQGQKLNFRWHYSANGTSGSWSGTHSTVCPGSISAGPQAMAGDLKVAPGTTLLVGYDFTSPGNRTPLSARVTHPQVVFTLGCVSGAAPSQSTLTVSMPTTTYTVTDAAWYPSGDQHSALVYQGSVSVPNVCGGGQVRLNKGGTFTAGVQ
jgi:acid phosphatase